MQPQAALYCTLFHINYSLSNPITAFLSWQNCLSYQNAGLDFYVIFFHFKFDIARFYPAVTSLKILLNVISAIHRIKNYFQGWSNPQIWKA